MDPQRSAQFWIEVQACVAAAEGLPPAQRTRVLDARCGTDTALRAEVESALRNATTVDVGAMPAPQQPTAAWSGSGDVSTGLVGARLGPLMVLDPAELQRWIGEG